MFCWIVSIQVALTSLGFNTNATDGVFGHALRRSYTAGQPQFP